MAKNKPQRLEMTSSDIVDERINELKQVFPEVFAEGKIDFDKLKAALGDLEAIDTGVERYGLSWAGKADSIRCLQTPSVGTLIPDIKESVNFDTTENIFIEGDNLEALKLLQKSYHGKIKMIYIDPPYNTGNEFIYPDNFKEGLDTYLKYTGQVDDEGMRVSTNTETSGRYHSNWLNMMYPRLFLARNLLRDDGILVAHIDEYEQHSLTMLLNEIFGEDSYLGTCIWDKRNPKGDARGVAYQHESILFYARNSEAFSEKTSLIRPKKNAQRMLEEARNIVMASSSIEQAEEAYRSWLKRQNGISGGEAMYKRISDKGRVYRLVSMAWPNKKKAPDLYFEPLIHPKTAKPCPVPIRGWRNPPETMQRLQEEGLIEFGEDETIQPQRIYFLEENMYENIPSVIPYGGSDDALFKKWGITFENPKPTQLAADIISWCTTEDDIVLDFFAGSCTTAHAVLKANNENIGSRRFIMVQLPEPCDEKSEAFKAGYKTISDIGRERIRRVIEKIKKEQAQEDKKLIKEERPELDLGFKSFRLAGSNFKIWAPDKTPKDTKGLETQLKLYAENVLPDRGKLEILYEIILKAGLELTTKVEQKKIAGKTVYIVEGGTIAICLEAKLTQQLLRGIIKLSPKVVIVLDNGFSEDDKLKTNTVLEMKSHEIEFKTV